MGFRIPVGAICALLLVNPCTWAQPDVIVGSLPNVANYDALEGIDAFAVATTSCNIGDEDLNWIEDTADHPVIAQNIYRLKDGRFEQLGLSWLKHGFTALQEDHCDDCPDPDPELDALAPGCSDPYSASLNGSQSRLGPRWEVNAATGVFPFPYTDDGATGSSIARRIQIPVEDLDPDLNEEAEYFIEGHYVALDDTEADNGSNNASWRAATVFDDGTDDYTMEPTDGSSTEREEAAIYAWQASDPDVEIVIVDVEDDGRFYVGYKVTDLGNGYWHYEYAIQNLTSDQAGGSLSVPITDGLGVLNLEFRDVHYHSGEPQNGDDWVMDVGDTDISWATDTYDTDAESDPEPNANHEVNALRWGTLYNFRFDANAAPVEGDVTLGLFKPGTVAEVVFTAEVPGSDFTLMPEDLICDGAPNSADLSWTAGETYDSVEIFRDGVSLVTLDGVETSYEDDEAGPGFHTYGVIGIVSDAPSGTASCTVDVPQVLVFDYPDGILELFPPTGHIMTISIEGTGANIVDASTATLYYDIGSGFVSAPLVDVGSGLFEASFPAADCETAISWYVAAENTDGDVAYDPLGGEADSYADIAAVTFSTTIDDMETDSGWVEGGPDDDATTGDWEWGDPIGTGAATEDDHTEDGTLCWFTENGTPGAGDGSADVDSGQTTLTSPELDLGTLNDPTISYWRWYTNSTGSTPDTDVFEVEISTDGEEWFEVETVGPTGTGPGWVFYEFRVFDVIEVGEGETVQIRFIASDEGSASLVEAAVDDVVVEGYNCFVDCNDNGVDDSTDLELGDALDCNENGIPDSCDIEAGILSDENDNGIGDDCETEFKRGDCNSDGDLNIADAIRGLGIIFLGEGPAPCEDACDTDDDGALALDDMITLLGALFSGDSDPAQPYPDCGLDVDSDLLDPCESDACL